MIHFSGTFQLAAIVKEDTTKKGDKMVYFTAFSRRGDQSDKVFCKCFGSTADYLMRNLTKKADGKYASRKLYLAGTLETYKQPKQETLPAKVITPEMLDKQLGVLKESIQISFTREVEEEKFMLKISYLDFEDKKKDSEIIEIYRSGSQQDNTVNTVSNDESHSKDAERSYSLAASLKEVTEAFNEPDLSGII